MYESIEQFIKAITDIGLVSHEDLDSHHNVIRDSHSPREAAAICVEKDLLTPYQAERILAGQVQDCIIAERFVLLERIGAGGMGNVFRARDRELDRVVAIKIMAPHNLQNPDAVMRFKREARALAQFALPNVVQAFDSGEDRGRNFLVMEYVNGVSLQELVRQRGKLPPTVAADYIYQTAVGMDQAHGRGLIHRDIKPANLLLTPEGHIKILDLGLARFVQDQIPDAELTRDNVGMGTPDYMAPEQFRDARSVDPRADIYSLGCTLYYLVTGLVPFPGSSLSEKMDAHENKTPPPLEERCPEVPAGLALTIERMMAKRPGDRIQHMKAVAEALAPYVAGSSPSLPSIRQTISFHGGRLPPARRWRMRSWGAAAITLMVLVAAALLWPQFVAPVLKQPADKSDIESLARDDIDRSSDSDAQRAGEGELDQPPARGDQIGQQLAAPDDPDVLTVSQAPEGGGAYRTIGAALREVTPGQTIRILDNAVYDEIVRINSPTRQRGIELESAHGATVTANRLAGNLVEISGVAQVSLRGLQIVARGTMTGQPNTLIAVLGPSSGFRAENLRFEAPAGTPVNALEYGAWPTADDEPPSVVERCEFSGGSAGIGVIAATADYKTSYPAGDLIVRDNMFHDVSMGIVVQGAGRRIQIYGNRILNAGRFGLQLENLLEPASHVLIANNTVFESDIALRVWDVRPRGEHIQIRNNVFLDSKTSDTLFIDSGGSHTRPRGPGDGTAVHGVWTMSRNTRQQDPPPALGPFAQAWIPPAEDDLAAVSSDGFHLDRNDLDNLLRPKTSLVPPATESNAGDPPLPDYIGALPPPGFEPFDWNKTWEAWNDVPFFVDADGDSAPRAVTGGDQGNDAKADH